MAKREEEKEVQEPVKFESPLVGTILTVASALSFQFLCMVLPLVGKAGMHPEREYAARGLLKVPGPHGFDSYVTQNRIAFLCVLFVTLGLSAAATMSKLKRRKADGSPFPKLSAGLVACCVGLLVAHVTGLLAL
jgi:hypothetical protein